MATPYKTSNDLIESVKRNVSFPIAQNTFSPDDLLRFANEEMMIGEVPSILQYQENYFSYDLESPLLDSQARYPIPTRAIGMNIRALFWKDISGNLFEMTQINPDDQAYFQRNVGANQAVHKYYFEGNDIVLTPRDILNPTGSLVFKFFIRPNQLVLNERAAICSKFLKNITVNNATIVAGDTLTIRTIVNNIVNDVVFIANTDFAIGVNSIATATNLANAITANATYLATNGSPSTDTVQVSYSDIKATFTATGTGIVVSTNQVLHFTTAVPSNITNASVIDFLETNGGHRMYKYDVTLGNNVVSGDMITFSAGQIPTNFKVGDYIASQHECIIPQIPDDLHISLVHRVCSRLMSAQGDLQASGDIDKKLGEVEQRQATLIDNRGAGDPKKLLARHSLLRYGKSRDRRRL